MHTCAFSAPRRRRTLLLLALLFSLPLRSASAATVTLESLLHEMTDRDAIAQWPQPQYQLREASSHDRRKVDPAEPGGWHSNNDHEQFIRTEDHDGRKEWVIMEETGPGAITRFWTPLLADKDTQIIRFYFDGASTAGIEVKLNDLLDGRAFVKPPLAFISWNQVNVLDERKDTAPAMRGVAGDLYLPIPFAHGCKITLDSIPFYYVINYRAYPPATAVETFSMDAFVKASDTIAKTGDALLADQPPAEAKANTTATIAAGQSVTLDLPAGPAAIDQLNLKLLDSPSESSVRSTIIDMEVDGEKTVWSPIGDFFGCGPRLRPVSDWSRTVRADGTMISRWIMPWKVSARLSLTNLAKEPIRVSYAVSTRRWDWDERSMLFHATWRGENNIKTRPFSDWNYLEATGEGVYAGDTLSVWNPVPDWYGEGDERIYVDGEPRPSHIGTGTEDYYGYAWGMADFFSSPFISEPRRDVPDRNRWLGYTTTSRLRLLDAIPFQKSLKHDMEIWNWADTRVDYAVAAFWYARPGSSSNRRPQPDQAAMPVHPAPPDPAHYKIAGAIECEEMRIAGKSPNLAIGAQDGGLQEGAWSGGKQLFAQAAAVGDFVELEVPVAGDKPVHLTLYATRSYDYGTLRFSLNGNRSSNDFDGYSPRAEASGPIDLGVATPVDGKVIVRVEVVGANPKTIAGRFYFGLDCITAH